ncbi:uncharacterized protein AMSG_05894 [Thecamonas trahens ATCC 50062]|uniref:EF-hand domain-containing protein n=1 Tax=Thecamonas trahens ATCC 50062 TaxID=461836 RepID=A0A0L0DCS1_THETB|nr:hypothetical protein AMSG_05894 [Thecamonas trahens ATCC 50062]KNC50122.1 hypothetical protein AMSG_05894 [Thecamonas trahens ATCC 50062]|eukprot:XP_013757281.1 hypothetical protein AMSG_05894 [Thecamonas trahens ATCC 50062]
MSTKTLAYVAIVCTMLLSMALACSRTGELATCEECTKSDCQFCRSSGRCVTSTASCSGTVETCQGSDINVGAISGAVISVIVFGIIGFTLVFCFMRSRRRARDRRDDSSEYDSEYDSESGRSRGRRGARTSGAISGRRGRNSRKGSGRGGRHARETGRHSRKGRHEPKSSRGSRSRSRSKSRGRGRGGKGSRKGHTTPPPSLTSDSSEIAQNRKNLLDDEAELKRVTKAAFRKYDTDKSGKLSKEQTRMAADRVCDKASVPRFTEDEFNEFFAQIDTDGNGELDRVEFKGFVTMAVEAGVDLSGYSSSL